ncbi:ThuA domain-containing protein [Cellvibrio mixtus]|uniref:ThuA domain-containing protein n=1 Tax=Cellvibrio mixtus TaxID=39650 RepID=UPI0006944776|nr:ThuA domain-containing protein [Cellvibrio mixtus]
MHLGTPHFNYNLRSFAHKKKNYVFLALVSLLLIVTGCDNNVSRQSGEQQTDASLADTAQHNISGARILVFSKTAGFRHESIAAGISALQQLASQKQFTLIATEDSAQFNDANLRQFNAVIFLNTTGDILDDNQQLAMERFIQAGGGFVGIHAATDTEWEGDWFWYRNLVGAVFKNHPNQPSNVQTATVTIADKNHPATKELPESFSLADEWYNYRDMYEFIHVLAKVDENTYQGGEHNHDHPISWYHEYDGGRAFYTGLGHTNETFSNAQFLQHLAGGISYVVGVNHRPGFQPRLDYSKVRPEDNRFVKKTLVEKLDEPVKLAFFPNGDALIALRPGRFQRVEYKTGQLSDAGTLTVGYDKFLELGLVGVAVAPDFANNPWIYAAFTVTKNVDGKKQLSQRLARFKWNNQKVDESTEHILLEYPIDNNCCHTGGDLQFGNNGELFFSTGDNTNPHDQDGYAPVDFRSGMKKNDGLRGAGNTMDLRGKVLRIKPKADTGYEIPAGNLFTDPATGRPEIYVMGARNPYSLTFDKKSGSLFYGDVGPDASKDSDQKGPMGYDEINRVTAAGNFGWPLVIGKNRPYNYFDYVNKKSGDWVDPAAPINNSPNNTGTKNLPPAQPAFIAYPYGISEEFPEMGAGGRTAIVADVYHAEDYPESVNRYPAYYNNKLFIVDFMRAWVKAVSFDEQGRVQKIEPFAPQINYALPIDSRFAPDGTLYVLEYGMSWFTGNPDARLSRIEYVGAGNRPPVANIHVDKEQAGIPAQIHASAKHSLDLDGDKIQYDWKLQCASNNCPDIKLGNEQDVSPVIPQAGNYQLVLTVTDNHGATTSVTQSLVIGNEPPTIQLKTAANKSFYWPDTRQYAYEFAIHDKEDGIISAVENNNVFIRFSYLAPTTEKTLGHQSVSLIDQGKSLVDANNCLACHKIEEKMVGPAFRDVAKKYQKDNKALGYLVNKIGNGGNGVWGEMNMPGFTGLSESERIALATYVLSLAEVKKPTSLPLSGAVELKNKSGNTAVANEPYKATGEAYVFAVNYMDKGANSIAPINVEKEFKLIPARLELATAVSPASLGKGVSQDKYKENDVLKFTASENWAGFSLGHYDLTDISSLKLGAYFLQEIAPWKIEIYRANPTGELLGSATVKSDTLWGYTRVSVPLSKPVNDITDIYIRVKVEGKSASELRLADVEFEK